MTVIADSRNDAHADGRKPLNSIFRQMGFERVKAVVSRALESRGQASESVCNALGSSIRASVRMDGFRDASRALPQQLTEPVMWEILEEEDDRLAGAVLRAWAESHSSLHDVVVAHLGNLGMNAEYPDFKANRFNSAWDWGDWLNECDSIVEAQNGLDNDDVALMLCYVSGRIPELPHRDRDGFRIEAPLFLEWLDRLDELPPDAPEWANMGRFVAAMAEIATEKAAVLISHQIDTIGQAVDEMVEDFGDELQYLDLDLGSWSEDTAARPSVVSEALELVEALKDELAGYHPVRPQASSRSDELQRADERRKCEEAILGIVARWEQMMDAAESPDDEQTPSSGTDESSNAPDGDGPAAGENDTADQGGNAHPTVPTSENGALGTELERVKREGESHRSENVALRRKNEGLKSDKTLLNAEISELRNHLSLSRGAEESWRRAYVSARQSGPVQHEPMAVLRVNDAVALAERTFPDELLFCLNSKSDKDSPFQRPEELFDVLAWLATEYSRLRTNPGASPDFNMLVKEACPGWSYKPHQAGGTKQQFTEWYTATADGKTYELYAHIGKGTSFDPQQTIRVAFAWDDDLKKVIVGYIGRHQRNRRS